MVGKSLSMQLCQIKMEQDVAILNVAIAVSDVVETSLVIESDTFQKLGNIGERNDMIYIIACL